MKNRLYIIALLSVVTLFAHAQTFQSATRPDYIAFQSMQILRSGSNYSGTVYEPFSAVTPSERSAIGARYSPAKSRPRRDFGKPGDPGNQSNESPIGDAVWPLMLFVGVYCGILLIRRKKHVKELKC